MRSRWIKACGLLLAGMCAAMPADDPYAKGLEAIEREGFGGLERAVGFFEAALSAPDRSRDARLAIARARILQFELSEKAEPRWLVEARRHLDALLAARPLDVDARFLLAQLLLDEGKPAEAMTHLRRATLAAPDREDVAAAYFHRLLEEGQIDQARLYAQRRLAGESAPELARSMAQGLLAAGDARTAADIAGRGLADAPDNPDWLELAARVARETGDYMKALACYEELMRVAPDRQETLFEIGLLHGLRGDAGEAIVWMRRFLEKTPDHLAALNNLAIFLEQSGAFDEAADVWRQILKRPGGDTVHHRRARERLARPLPPGGRKE